MTIYPESSSGRHVVPARNIGPNVAAPIGHFSSSIVAGMSLTGLLALGACASDAPTAAIPGRDLPPALWTLAITPSRNSMYVGESVTLFLRATDPAGEQVAASSAATWTTSDAGVATVKSRGSRETAVTAMRPGVVTITATLQGRSVIQALTILSVPDAAGSLLVVESFRILEFQYPTAPGQWFYRSQMRLRATGNNDSVVVTGMTFLIPGLGAVPPCKNVIMLSGNTPADVFTEIRSDLQFLGAQPGVRATGDEATVIVTVTDGRGVSTDIVARGEIVAVTFPQTPPGGGVSRKCF